MLWIWEHSTSMIQACLQLGIWPNFTDSWFTADGCKILHHLGWLNPYNKYWDRPPLSTGARFRNNQHCGGMMIPDYFFKRGWSLRRWGVGNNIHCEGWIKYIQILNSPNWMCQILTCCGLIIVTAISTDHKCSKIIKIINTPIIKIMNTRKSPANICMIFYDDYLGFINIIYIYIHWIQYHHTYLGFLTL